MYIYIYIRRSETMRITIRQSDLIIVGSIAHCILYTLLLCVTLGTIDRGFIGELIFVFIFTVITNIGL